VTDGVVTDGVVTDGVVTDGVVTDGVVTDGVVTDGVVTDGVVTDAVSVVDVEFPRLVERLRAATGAVQARMAAACARAGRDPSEVRLVVISKTFAVPVIRAAVAAGVTELGENRVQEAQEKIPECRAPDGTSLVTCRATRRAGRSSSSTRSSRSIPCALRVGSTTCWRAAWPVTGRCGAATARCRSVSR